MSSANQISASILETVINSGLDYHINQTPYSVHFSIRKKLSRISHQMPSSSPIPKLDDQKELLRQELLNTRNEYQRLYNFYLMENEAKCKIEEEYREVLEKVTDLENTNTNIKTLKAENQKLKEKYEFNCQEAKHLKNEIESLNKDKNALSVALKAAKADTKEQSKQFAKKEKEFEKKISELYEYRRNKLAEEREEKLRSRKEIKKAKRKTKYDLKEASKENYKKTTIAEPDEPRNNITELKPQEDNLVKEVDVKDGTEDITVNDDIESDPNGNLYEMALAPIETIEASESEGGEPVVATDDLNTKTGEEEPEVRLAGMEAESLDENDEAFIGPRLPRRMTTEEIKEFKKELFAKYFPT